jgi:oligopeptide/dipeptide ABC transporter ATP-binding protein
MIAMALVCRPKLLIADEPTTALDVTIQAQVLELMHRLRDELDMAILFVTHDLGVVADIATTAAVMYAGQIVEHGPVAQLLRRPAHPYTRALLDAMPDPQAGDRGLRTVAGSVPLPQDWPTGCRFEPRCPMAIDACRAGRVPMSALGGGGGGDHDDARQSRCVRAHELVGEVVSR